MANTYEKERQLQDEIGSRVEHDLPGVEVLAVELSNPDRFVVYVDHPEGVDHELCVRVTDTLRDYLREYTVDVSSPGIERPLRKPQHFAAALGRKVSLRTREPLDGRSKFKGELEDVRDDALTLAVDGTHVEIPYETIVRGNLIDER
ncbi:MAG: ribosome maturation factor RimP [Gaiellaceae bacterium]|jgi:ribosome maturation factor RimP|nr:ribosome maturation factor RimP [Gaiellaceae bacterium]